MSEASKQFELLAPGGDVDAIKAAIAAGADAIYCGLERFNARNRATNITFDVLDSLVELAHQHDCQIFITLNVIILESEIAAVTRLLAQLSHTQVDGVIVQDIGLAYLLKHVFPQLDVHASTQMNTHNKGQISFVNGLGVSRVNLSRELRVDEIKPLATFGRQHGVLMEVFVHGSYCIGFSGLCYASSVGNGTSGNRGRCGQPCRDQFQPTATGSDFPLNMKDNSAFLDMEALADAGVYSLKVEGRIKKSHYVYQVVDQWRQQIDRYCNDQPLLTDLDPLYTVFNRDFSNGFLRGNVGQDMYIDNPRDFAAQYRIGQQGVTAPAQIKAIKTQLYDDKTAVISKMEAATKAFDVVTAAKPSSLKGQGEKITLPTLEGEKETQLAAPRLSVMVASEKEIEACAGHDDTTAIYYRLPDGLARESTRVIELLKAYPHVIPWFSAILIGDDFDAAVNLLETLKPARIVTENSGVGFAASTLSIDWVAGPQFNITNSYTLKCLKEEYGCVGAFISDEINAKQMKQIICPPDFELMYNIFHPMTLMTSRQCLFQQSSGCKKIKINKGCIPRCNKHTSIVSLNGNNGYVIDKQRGSYNQVFATQHCLNTQVMKDLPRRYNEVMIDMRAIKTETQQHVDTCQLLGGFSELLAGERETLDDMLSLTINRSYLKGL